MALTPMIESSSMPNRLVIPAAAIALPPTPESRTVGSAAFTARASAAPKASPDSSAATMKIAYGGADA
jgi:hypothetical protein